MVLAGGAPFSGPMYSHIQHFSPNMIHRVLRLSAARPDFSEYGPKGP